MTRPWPPEYRGPRSPLHTKEPPAAANTGRKGRKAKAKPVSLAAGFDGRRLDGTRVVDDPFAIEPGAKMVARVNVAEHPLEWMLARGRLSAAHYEAGSRFRAIYARAEIGGAKAMDLAKEKVDGGGAGDVLSDSVMMAHRELHRLARSLGPVGWRVVEQVCGMGVAVTDLAKTWPGREAERAKMDYLTLRLKEALDTLATVVWGARGRDRLPLRAWADEPARWPQTVTA